MRLHPSFSLPFQGKTLFLLCGMGLPIAVFADQPAPPVTPTPQTPAVVAPANPVPPAKAESPAPEPKKESPAPAKETPPVAAPKPAAKPNALPELPAAAKSASAKTPAQIAAPGEKTPTPTPAPTVPTPATPAATATAQPVTAATPAITADNTPPTVADTSATPVVAPPVTAAPADTAQKVAPATPVAPEEALPEPSRSKVLSESDEMGRSVRITFFDKNNNPTNAGQLPSAMESKTLGATGFASVKFDYDGDHKDDKPVLWEFFDTEGNPVLTSMGYSKITFEHNKEGREVKRSYLGKHDEPVNTQFGFSSIKRTFDGTKRLTRETYYDKDNKIVNNSRLGYAIKNVAYVNNDKEEYDVTTFMDAQANPVKIGGAYKQIHGVSKSDPPLTIVQSYNNQNDTLMNGPDGYALHITRPIDNSHNPKEAYMDELSQLTDGPEGFAQLVLTQEKGKNLYKLQYYDLAGVPTNNKALGWCYKIFRMSKDGEQKDAVFYDKNGNRVIINEPY